MTLLKNREKIQAAAVPFQVEDAAKALRRKRVVLGHKTGLGKTFITILAMTQMAKLDRILVVGTASAIGVWRRKLKQWCDADAVVMVGGSDPAWKQASDKRQSGIWLCTYATARTLLAKIPNKRGALPFDVLILDELHKALRNRTATWKALRAVHSEYFFGLTATWASKGPQDLWPVLNLIDHTHFSSYWDFVGTWCYTEPSTYGSSMEIVGVKNGPQLKEFLNRNYYIVRTWKEVGNQFRAGDNSTDPVIRRMELVDMTDEQSRLYYSMLDKMEARHGDQLLLAQNSLDRLTRLLQLSLSPRMLFPSADVGGPVAWLFDQASQQTSTVVFVPYKPLVHVCAEYFRDSGYELPMYNLYGGLAADVVDATIADWKKKGGTIFCTISYAQSFELDISDNAYMLGFDWDPNNNIQAEGRLRRFDSVLQTPCLCTYIIPAGSHYEDVKEVVNGKVADVQKVLASYGL